jgi:hypothetical protein
MIAGEHVVHRLPGVDDHEAVFWRCGEEDVIAGLNVVKPSRCGWDNDAGLKGDGEKTVGRREDYDPAKGGNYFKLVSGSPAESADDIVVLDSPGCVYGPDAVKHCGVA